METNNKMIKIGAILNSLFIMAMLNPGAVLAGPPVTILEKSQVVVKPKKSQKAPKISSLEIAFSYNSGELGKMEILKLAQLSVPSTAKITVTGHASSEGKAQANQKIAETRAKNTAAQLQLIFPYAQISYKGMSIDNPKYPNDTEENRAKNRRSFIVVGM